MIDLKLTSTGYSTSRKLIVIFIVLFYLASYVHGSDLKIENIIFTGLYHFNEKTLLNIIKSNEGKEFNYKYLNIDKTLIENYYRSKGFLDVWIESNWKRKGSKTSITYNILEGKRFFLEKIQIFGNVMINDGQARSFFKIKRGDIFQKEKLDAGLNSIEKYYLNNGKPYVGLIENIIKHDSLITVKVKINEAETVYIKDIEYKGLYRVKKYIIRRELEIHKGDIYSRNKIDKSQKNIYSTGLFNYVGFDIKTRNAVREDVILIVKVIEKKSRYFGIRFGVAYEQEILYGGTFDFTLEFGHRNLFGTARTVMLNIIPSLSYDFNARDIINPKNQYSFTYIEPWIGYTRTPGVLRASFLQIRPINSADYNYFTSSFQVNRDFNGPWRAIGTISFNKVEILEEDTLSEVFFNQTRGQDIIYSISSKVIRDKRDNYLNPQDGSVVETGLKFAYVQTRSKFRKGISINRFFRYTIQWSRYQSFPLKRDWVLASRVRGGNIIELGNRSQIPISERFFLGGASTVRGYSEQLLGPISYDKNNQPEAVGGKLLLLGNIELRIPIFWLFWGEIFSDAGNVWLETNRFRILDIKTTSGMGLALLTPLGPVRFDYGLKHQPEKDESKGEFHISISFAF